MFLRGSGGAGLAGGIWRGRRLLPGGPVYVLGMGASARRRRVRSSMFLLDWQLEDLRCFDKDRYLESQFGPPDGSTATLAEWRGHVLLNAWLEAPWWARVRGYGRARSWNRMTGGAQSYLVLALLPFFVPLLPAHEVPERVSTTAAYLPAVAQHGQKGLNRP